MNKKIVKSVLMIGAVLAMVGGATTALFSDTETVSVADISAGTLDLKLDDGDAVVHVDMHDIAPGWSKTYKWCLKNTGSIAGDVSVEFSTIDNQENGTTEPEDGAEDDPYGYIGARATLGRTEGELGEYLKPNIMRGPCSWSVGSQHFGPGSVWATGPTTNYGTWGLDSLGGNTYDAGVSLDQDKTIGIFLTLTLDDDLDAWDGAWTHNIDDNVIQSDKVLFDIIFHLDQVTP